MAIIVACLETLNRSSEQQLLVPTSGHPAIASIGVSLQNGRKNGPVVMSWFVLIRSILYIYVYIICIIYIPGVSTTLRFWGRLQNTSFLGTFDTFWGRFMQKRPFIFQAGAGHIH